MLGRTSSDIKCESHQHRIRGWILYSRRRSTVASERQELLLKKQEASAHEYLITVACTPFYNIHILQCISKAWTLTYP